MLFLLFLLILPIQCECVEEHIVILSHCHVNSGRPSLGLIERECSHQNPGAPCQSTVAKEMEDSDSLEDAITEALDYRETDEGSEEAMDAEDNTENELAAGGKAPTAKAVPRSRRTSNSSSAASKSEPKGLIFDCNFESGTYLAIDG